MDWEREGLADGLVTTTLWGVTFGHAGWVTVHKAPPTARSQLCQFILLVEV